MTVSSPTPFAIRPGKPDDAPAVLALYRSLFDLPGCTWNEHYPILEDILDDVSQKGLYVMEASPFRSEEKPRIIAAASAVPDQDLKELPVWDNSRQNVCFLARVAVAKDRLRQGLARTLLNHVLTEKQKQGFETFRLLVGKSNSAAVALYEDLGFQRRGEIFAWDVDWFCYER